MDTLSAEDGSAGRFQYLSENRHKEFPHGAITLYEKRRKANTEWRTKDKMKTVSVALVACLNLGVTPPGQWPPSPCARLECWIDPKGADAAKTLEAIGRRLQMQYERWQPRAKYRQALDPTPDEIKRLAVSLRKQAKDDRVLFHYNGHGVPKPTTNGEIWSWLQSPTIYVFDCAAAGVIVDCFVQFAENRDKEIEKYNVGETCVLKHRQSDSIILGACDGNASLPVNPDLPADLFTACITTPIKMALRWFSKHSYLAGVSPELIDEICSGEGRFGKYTDRKAPLGELNWIFTAVTDTIAWNILPRDLFQRLFRQDLMVASLFRNYLLAERIMRSANCRPASHPRLPPGSHRHPLWEAWDLAVETCLVQIQALEEAYEASLHTSDAFVAGVNVRQEMKREKLEGYKQSLFFSEQLTAFEVWLDFGSKERGPPEQLPIVLQVLLSQSHRLRALKLLARFVCMGQWATDLALSVGIFPYVLKLLQSPAMELRPVLIEIWSRILYLDETCKIDLLKDNCHVGFVDYISNETGTPTGRVCAAFVLCLLLHDSKQARSLCRQGQALESLSNGLRSGLKDLELWCLLGLGKLVDGSETSSERNCCQFLERVLLKSSHSSAEIRAAVAYVIGCWLPSFINDVTLLNRASRVLQEAAEDASPMVRYEAFVVLSKLVDNPAVRESLSSMDKAINSIDFDIIRTDDSASVVDMMASSVPKSPLQVGSAGKQPLYQTQPMVLEFSGRMNSQDRLSARKGANLTGSPHDSAMSGAAFNSVMREEANMSEDPLARLTVHSHRFIWIALQKLTFDPVPDISKGANAILIELSSGQTLEDQEDRVDGLPDVETASHRHVSPSSSRDRKDSGSRRTSPRSFLRRFGKGASRDPSPMAVERDRRRSKEKPIRERRAHQSSSVQNEHVIRRASFKSAGSLPMPRSELFAWLVDEFVRLDEEQENKHAAVRSGRWNKKNMPFDLDLPVNIRSDSRPASKRSAGSIDTSLRVSEPVILLQSDSDGIPSAMRFSFEDPYLYVAKGYSDISVWNYEKGIEANMFKNGNSIRTKVSSLEIINGHYESSEALLCTGSTDGVVRCWRDVVHSTVRVATSFHALPEISAFIPQSKSATFPFFAVFRPMTGQLICGGAAPVIRVWDLAREQAVQTLQTLVPSAVTALTVDQGADYAGDADVGSLVAAGLSDGTLHVYDLRVGILPVQELHRDESTKGETFAPIHTLTEHGRRIAGARLVRQGILVSGSEDGIVCIWDVRKCQPIRVINTGCAVDGMAVHCAAPIFATGSDHVNVYNFDGERTASMRYYDGFLSTRIAPIKHLAFHPSRMLLASASQDSLITVYGSEAEKSFSQYKGC